MTKRFLLDVRQNREVIGCQVRAVRRMAHQLKHWASQKGAGLSRCVRAGIVMVNNDSSSLVRFSNFSEDFRQINCGVPYRIDRPTMVKWNSRHMTSVAEETGHYLLRSDFFTNNFRWIWLVFERSNSSFWLRKSLTTHVFLMCGHKETSLGAKSGLYGR